MHFSRVFAAVFVFLLSAFSNLSWASNETKEIRILFIGDSLTAGYGVKKEEAFPDVLEQLLLKKFDSKIHVQVTNAGISGSLSSSAVSRVRFGLKLNPQILVLELGSNDALKGTETSVIKKNLAEAIDLAQKNHIQVLLIGMQVYSNYGEAYSKAYKKIFVDLSKEKKIPLMPFLLEGVALNHSLMQKDQKHPNALGHKLVAENLLKYIEPLIRSVSK